MKEIKAKVIQDIIDLMDQEEGNKLKKHPKLMAAKITIAKPINKEEIAGEMESKKEDIGEDPNEEQDMESMPMEDMMGDFDELPDDVKAKLLKKLC